MKFLIPFSVIVLVYTVACYADEMQSTTAEPELNCLGNTTFGGFADCRQRCDNFDNPPLYCPPLYIKRACVCKRFYIPVDATSIPLRCVYPQDCPK
ncbi:hypothetical protein NPIL_345541 [Nephila pilipes]|uniref:Spider venom protein n=1 Tax=Nephila pilipes TaxID=299642 RepID=A0A8X6NUI1_NEPPI|nr:hypothetical protein NPIL_345541 [Nephila pilipes]